MYGLTVRETMERREGPGILDRLSSADLGAFPVPHDPPDLRGYIDLAIRGGFPQPVLRLGDAARQAWLEAYIDQLVSRDAETLDGARDPARAPPLLRSIVRQHGWDRGRQDRLRRGRDQQNDRGSLRAAAIGSVRFRGAASVEQ